MHKVFFVLNIWDLDEEFFFGVFRHHFYAFNSRPSLEEGDKEGSPTRAPTTAQGRATAATKKGHSSNMLLDQKIQGIRIP